MAAEEPKTEEQTAGETQPEEGQGQAVSKTQEDVTPELFIGVILPQGVPWDSLTQALRTVLKWLGYELITIRLTDELRRIASSNPEEKEFRWTKVTPDGRYKETRDGAARLVELLGKGAMAHLGVNSIHESRPDKELEVAYRHAYCFQSLKRPEEVEVLQDIYGQSFICIAAHLPREQQLEIIAKRVAAARFQANPNVAKPEAQKRILHDDEGGPYGERISDAISKADIFIDVSGTRESIEQELWRSISSLFGSPFQTPTPDEQGMSIAYLAALRSAHPKRQVGAVLTSEDGSLLAIGCNEVPAPQGGLYWTGDKDDRRDFQLQDYTSRAMREEILGDVLQRLAQQGYLSDKKTLQFASNPGEFFQELNLDPVINDSRLMDAIEYDRTVHAEMAAITDAARRGISLQGCTLYCTTLPCHNCARHIVAAGVKRVVYIQPFEKSLVERLHDDAILFDARPRVGDNRVRFEHFIGIAPSLYSPLFSYPAKGRLKEGGREFVEWAQEESEPVISKPPWVYLIEEGWAVVDLLETMKTQGLYFRERKPGEQEEEQGGQPQHGRKARQSPAPNRTRRKR